MKMFLVFAYFSMVFTSNAQDCKNYYFLQNNKVVEMTIYDKKGDVTGKLVYTVSEVKNSGNTTAANVQSQMFDKKGKSIAKGNSVMKCSGGVMMIDMKMMIPQAQLEPYSHATVKAEDVYMEYPVNMNKGEPLKDGNLTMDIDNNGLKQSLTMTVSNRKVEDKEKISTPAGTWDCYRISYMSKMSIKMMGVGVPINMEGTEWYAPGFGVVKTQSKYGATEITGIK